ncbi:MAG: phosphoglucosamine mutase, partial [Terriglobales bacterium]
MKRYFGTDGVRGVAGEAPLDRATVVALGVALGRDLASRNRAPAVVLGEDTRESSGWIAATLAAGLQQAGVRVEHAGVLPTPAVAYLAASGGFAAGVMVSASHNPYQDNGIKVFGPTGYKLPDEEEAAVERSLEAILAAGGGVQAQAAELRQRGELRQTYVEHLAGQFADVPWGGMRVVVDCAHGAASTVAPELFQRLGLEAAVMAAAPDGRNINAGVGALHPEKLAEEVRRRGAAAGLALDGDADRAILVDGRGEVVNGDAVLLMCARELWGAGPSAARPRVPL